MKVQRTVEVRVQGDIRIFNRGPFVVIEKLKGYDKGSISVVKTELEAALHKLRENS